MHQAFNTIQTRSISAFEPFVFTICKIQAGETFNVFPNTAFMQGSIRFYNNDVCDLAKKRIQEIASHVAESNGCTVEVRFWSEFIANTNSDTEFENVKRIVSTKFGEDKFTQAGLPLTGSEDFSYFSREKPGCFVFFGSGKVGEPYR